MSPTLKEMLDELSGKPCTNCGTYVSAEGDTLCLECQLKEARAENAKLKSSVEKWKEAWFELREIIGWLWWHHPGLKK